MGLPVLVGRQSHVAYMPAKGHQVVLGTAGTGKTVMAMVRAQYLCAPGVAGSGRTLLVTYNNALVAYLKHLADNITGQLDIRTYGRFARGYLSGLGLLRGYNDILGAGGQKNIMAAAIKDVRAKYNPSRFFDRPIDWFRDEVNWLAGMGIRSEQAYLDADRLGRRTALNSGLRSPLWQIAERYWELRRARGFTYDWDDIASAVREQIKLDRRPSLYRHIVIDEGQDLTPEQIRSLVEVVDPDGSVTFFGDYAQQIYGQGMSWRSCGLKIRHTETFRDNYRNSTAIAQLAIALSKMPFFGSSDDLVEPQAPRSDGPKPTLARCQSRDQEISLLRKTASQLGSLGSVAIIGHSWSDVDSVCVGLNSRRLDKDTFLWDPKPGIYRTTYHSAKGLEFDSVLMPFCGVDSMPLTSVVESLGELDAAERESKLLYVALTRARSNIVITYSGDRTRLLPTTSGLFTEVDAEELMQ